MKEDGNYVLCDYGSCSLEMLIPEVCVSITYYILILMGAWLLQKMGIAQCEEQIKRFTTLAYRAPEMVDLYSGKSITISSDVWVRVRV